VIARAGPFRLRRSALPDVVLEQADLLVVAAPHQIYRSLVPQVPLVDIWNVVPSTGPA